MILLFSTRRLQKRRLPRIGRQRRPMGWNWRHAQARSDEHGEVCARPVASHTSMPRNCRDRSVLRPQRSPSRPACGLVGLFSRRRSVDGPQPPRFSLKPLDRPVPEARGDDRRPSTRRFQKRRRAHRKAMAALRAGTGATHRPEGPSMARTHPLP